MKTQHTQVQWKYLYDDKRDNYQIYSDRIWVATTKGDACSKSQEANARLIASAPELLESLTNIMSWLTANNLDIDCPMGYRNQAYTAIAKAKGEL